MAGRIRELLDAAPRAESEEARLRRLLKVFVAISLGVTVAFLGLAWPMLQPRARLLTLSLAAVLGGLAVFLPRPPARAAAAGYLAALWLFVTASLWLFGAFTTPAATAYVVVAMAAALLFGVRGGAAASAVVAASCVLVALAHARGWTPPVGPIGAGLGLAVLLASLLSVIGMALYATAELRRAVAGLRREVEERQAVEERLRESESRFRSIVDSSPMAILLYRLDPDGRLVLTGSNPNSDRVLGMRVGDLVGLTIEEAFPALVGTEVPDRYRRLCAVGGSWQTEVTYRDDRVSGTYEVHAFQTTPGLVAVLFLDVSPRREAEEERRRR